MKLTLLLVLVLMALQCCGQTTTGKAETAGSCSPAVPGNNNIITITCSGVGKEQGQKMLAILNKILANQIDPETVMTKLDEILKAVNPNTPVKTYFCNGTWRTAGPGKNAGFEISMGGDDSIFQEMVRLNNSQHYSDLRRLCLSQIQSAPGWLTPRLFCGLAYLGLGEKSKAKEMLKEFDAKTGPAYDTDACSQASTYLHNALQ